MEGPLDPGTIVTLPFPYFDEPLKIKNRPALVVASNNRFCILCQITSQPDSFPNATQIASSEFEYGDLSHPSQIRVDMLFTASYSIINRIAGRLTDFKLDEVRKMLTNIFLPKFH